MIMFVYFIPNWRLTFWSIPYKPRHRLRKSYHIHGLLFTGCLILSQLCFHMLRVILRRKKVTRKPNRFCVILLY